jgi:ribonuclease E
MTEETTPTTVDVPTSASSNDGADTASNGSAASTGGAPGTGGARRRRRRGGRGRGGRGRSTSASSTSTGGTTDGTSVEIDLDAQPGDTERAGNETIVAADGSGSTGDGSTSPRPPGASRRRRGGRGRGRSGGGTRPTATTSPDGDDAPASDATSSTASPSATPRPARRRPAATAASPDADPNADGSPDADASLDAEASAGDGDGTTTPARRRRRRGGRGRGGSKKPATTTDGEATSEPAEKAAGGPTRTRRAAATPTRTRTRRSPSSDEGEAPTSTRLKRQRQSRQVRRRRDVAPPVERITDKLMVVTEHGERDQIAVLEGRDLVQHYVTRQGAHSMVGNVYMGRVQNVLPGMEAAFVDVGRGRNAVLYAGEVNWSPEDLEGAAPRIERALKSGQSVLVQVTKDPIGGKGARLTAQISLPGRFLVLAPNSSVTGISRRLPDDERKRLKSIYKKIKPDQHGLIVRTAAEGASEEALTEDLNRLVATWDDIEKRSKKAKAPAVLYEEPELTLRVVRDLFTDEEYRELVTDSKRIYELITGYLRDIAPDVLPKVRLHEGKLSAFEEFHIVEQIHKGLDRKVWLPSGGYLVIDRTEALTVIDVNTGKSVGKTNLEETVVNTNVEAAREVARQLRLRDIGGMIVIDFIDMLLEQNKRKVIDEVKMAMAQDKTRSQVFDISPLGLLEVTRKRVSGGLLESFSETCPTCEGRGVLLTYDVN